LLAYNRKRQFNATLLLEFQVAWGAQDQQVTWLVVSRVVINVVNCEWPVRQRRVQTPLAYSASVYFGFNRYARPIFGIFSLGASPHLLSICGRFLIVFM
jgi:hypothetical protein